MKILLLYLQQWRQHMPSFSFETQKVLDACDATIRRIIELRKEEKLKYLKNTLRSEYISWFRFWRYFGFSRPTTSKIRRKANDDIFYILIDAHYEEQFELCTQLAYCCQHCDEDRIELTQQKAYRIGIGNYVKAKRTATR